PAPVTRDGARARRGERCLHVRGHARRAGGRARARHVFQQEKIEHAKELGAAGGALYTEDGWAEAVGPVDLVLDSVGSTWQDSLNALRPGGRLVVFGGTGGAEVTINVRATYLNWKS